METKFQFNQDSRYKTIVYFMDGNSRTFNSRDLNNKGELRPDMGLARLRKMILNFGASVKIAITYDKASNKELERISKQTTLENNENQNKSKFKAVVYFTDGNKRTFYSYDVDVSTGEINPNFGLNKLNKMIEKFGDKVKFSMIYDNTTNQAVIFE